MYMIKIPFDGGVLKMTSYDPTKSSSFPKIMYFETEQAAKKFAEQLNLKSYTVEKETMDNTPKDINFKDMLENKQAIYKDQINSLVELCGGLAKQAGWWTDLKTGEPKKKEVGDLISLIHSEVSEAYEAYRKDWRKDDHLPQYDGLTVELADAVIRIFDMADNMKLDLANALVDKLVYNTQRQDHKLENRMKDGGKKV